jgi:hypothetical protein
MTERLWPEQPYSPEAKAILRSYVMRASKADGSPVRPSPSTGLFVRALILGDNDTAAGLS